MLTALRRALPFGVVLTLLACGDGTDSECAALDCACTTDETCAPLVGDVSCVEGRCRLVMGPDAGAPDAGAPAVGWGPDPTSLRPADLACLGARTAPLGGGLASLTLRVGTERIDRPVEGVVVQVFTRNTPSLDGSCAGSCQTGTTGSFGELLASVPAPGWFAYRIEAGTGMVDGSPEDFVESVHFNVNAGDRLLAFRREWRDELLLPVPMAGERVITGRLLDCDGAPLANATVRLFDAGEEVPLGSSMAEPRAVYFDAGRPAGGARATGLDGRWAIVRPPAPNRGYRVELWGVTRAGAPAERLGCEQVRAPAGGVGVVDVGPLRSDAPSGC